MIKLNNDKKSISIDMLFNNMILDKNKQPLMKTITNSWATMMSSYTIKSETIKDKVILITQFYIDNNSRRQKEILDTLKFNLNNIIIDEILLFNERQYSVKELDVINNKNKAKIKQIIIGRRLKFNDIFQYIDENKLKGYILIANSDIFFDNTLNNIFECGLTKNKKLFSQLRFEYNNLKVNLFGPRGDSQDAWIFHTNYNVEKNQQKLFNFELGIPGCDNHIIYLLKVLGYRVHNEPYLLKIYHNHGTEKRNYNNNSKRIQKPWIRLLPFLNNNYPDFNKYINNWWRFNFVEENNHLFSYIENKVKNNEKFIIVRINGEESHFVELGAKIINNKKVTENESKFLNANKNIIKEKEGLKIDNINDLLEFTKLYLESLNKCDCFFELEPGTLEYRNICNPHNLLIVNFSSKQTYSLQVLEIYNNIFNNPWTLALKNKRLLIISSNVSIIANATKYREHIYNIDLFPQCSFEFIQAPQTFDNNNSEAYINELNKLIEKIVKVKDKFDIALLACKGFDNIIAEKLYNMDKSAICVGDLLYSYFGIYNKQLMETKGCILKLFMNNYWTLLR